MVKTKDLQMASFSQHEIVNSISEASENNPVIVDFDETLLLRNSTAEYLNSLQPRLIGSLLLKTIAFLKPWKLLARSSDEGAARDWFLVVISTVLMPWNLLFWPRVARDMGLKHTNLELTEELNKNSQTKVIVATLGFNFIISPILEHMPVKYQQLIGCRFWNGLKDRNKGKLEMVKEQLSSEDIAASILVTDSLDDLPLLKQVDKPILMVWDKAQYNYPMSDIYFPLMYIHKVKRIGENYIAKAILLDDLPILLLSLTWISSQHLIHGLGILLLTISFWCIYEYGYYENDVVADRYEQNPTLSKSYYNSQITMNWWQPWIWALMLGGLGTFALALCQFNPSLYPVALNGDISEVSVQSVVLLSAWVGFLASSRLSFWVYNIVNKQTRIWLYMVLQLCRYCGFLAVTGTNLVGISILLAHTLSRTISYIVYRYAGGSKKDWPKLQEKFLRSLLFIVVVGFLSVATADWSLLLSWQTAAISLFCILRGGQHFQQVINIVGPINQKSTEGAV